MSDDSLHELQVLALDCQAGGATPAYGDLLELGWAVCSAHSEQVPVRSQWLARRTTRPVSRAVRELTGWSEACAVGAPSDREVWTSLCTEISTIAQGELALVPTVIHFARFELTFLRELHARVAPAAPFPLDPVCVHTIATRLFPELPRRNIRALAGFLGHSTELIRRAAGHVEATASIWRALVPRLAEESVHTWSELKAWLEQPVKTQRREKLVYPLAVERRRALPDVPGIYRFVRSNGDVLYVGKAASLKKRVASHFTARGRTTERALEMLTQVHDIRITETASVLEAALAEVDEIKRIDPPYNVQLRRGERSAWFFAIDLSHAVSTPDVAHPIGPLPAERALSSLLALVALTAGSDPTPKLQAMALAVPSAALPELLLFNQGWSGFFADYLAARDVEPRRRVDAAARALWRERRRTEPELAVEEGPPALWDLARVRRRLERNLVQAGLVLRRARVLSLLADADVVFREREMPRACWLNVACGAIIERRELESVAEIVALPSRPARSRLARQGCFDAASYDRLRVLLTELRRVEDDGGQVALRFGKHAFIGPRLAKLMSEI